MWEAYSSIRQRYSRISLQEERELIAHAQKGSQKKAEELVLRHIGFVIFRIHKKAFPAYVRRFGEDLLSQSILILYDKVKSYDLGYKDKGGHPKPVRFVSYIWKRIDGFIIDSLTKEIEREKQQESPDWERFDHEDQPAQHPMEDATIGSL
ncbi:MAG: hypothetical protein HYZ73_04070 [Elusimicrobia bacterium]|nr:hypothetical protein [Elusimicrobiota bacterium]